MDPLFGFVDEISEHQQQQTPAGGGGDSTMSFRGAPAAPPPAQNYQGQMQSQLSIPGSSSSVSSTHTQPVVRVVTGKSEDSQQIYVIKLEKILQDNTSFGGGNQLNSVAAGETMDASGEVGGGATGMASAGGESESRNFMEDEEGWSEEAKEEEDDDGPDPNLVIDPEAVMAISQSVGIEINEDDASELGCIAVNKLRQAVLIAMRFSQSENSAGIQAEHFTKAEEQLGSRGFGHESVFCDPPFKYAGGVSVIDDGPEIDVFASISKNFEESRKIPVDHCNPGLHVHRLRRYDFNARENNSSSNFDLYAEPVVTFIPESMGSSADGKESKEGKQGCDPSESDVSKEGDSEATKRSSQSAVDVGNGDNLPEEMEFDEIPDELFDEYDTQASSHKDGQQSKVGNSEHHSSSDNNSERGTIAPEWSPYLKVLFEQTLSSQFKDELDCYPSSELKLILNDIRNNGAHPIFHIICDTFRDYLRNPNISLGNIVRVLAVADILVSSDHEPTLVQMTDLGSLLIEIISLPPPCEVHHLLTNIFMKVLKTCDELLTWTCTYVTEMLKGIGDTPMDRFLDPLKCTMHGALCLANGLEELKIQVAQEFGWHSSVMNFSRNHSAVFDGQAYCLTEQDSYLEEEVLKFYHNFLSNYTGRVPPSELSKIREAVSAMYGERFSSFSAFPDPALSKRMKYNNATKTLQYLKTRCMYKKNTYKNREVV